MEILTSLMYLTSSNRHCVKKLADFVIVSASVNAVNRYLSPCGIVDRGPNEDEIG
jgi:hypothetical protein